MTYVAGSSAVPFCCSNPRLESEPPVFPFVFVNEAGAKIFIPAGRGVATAVFVAVKLGTGDPVAVGVNTDVLVGAAVGEPRGIAVGVLDGNTAVEVNVGRGVAVLVGEPRGIAVGVLEGNTAVEVNVGKGVAVLVGTPPVDVLVGDAPDVGVLVGVSVASVPVGVAVASVPVTVGVKVTVGVLVGTDVVFAASPRAITSTSPRAAAFPFTELNWIRTTRVSTSLKFTFVPPSANAPEFLFAASMVPAASLNRRTVASNTLTLESEPAGLYKRTVRTVTGTGKVNCTHCVVGLPDWLDQNREPAPVALSFTRRSLIPLLEPLPVDETVTVAPVARFVHCASAGEGTGIIV